MTPRWIRAGLGPLVVALALAGCGSASPSPPTASPFSLYTHCGIREARLGNHYYVAVKPLIDGGNPPIGWNNPYQDGTMTITSATTALFRDSKGHRVTFRLRPGATGFLQLCS